MVRKKLRWEVPALPSLRILHPEFVAFSLQSTSVYLLSYNPAFSKNTEKAPPTIRYKWKFKKNLSKHRLLSLQTAETNMTMKPRVGWLPRWQQEQMIVSQEASLKAGAHVPGSGADCQPRRGEKVSYFGEHSTCLLRSSSLPFLLVSKAISGLLSAQRESCLCYQTMVG